MLLVASDPCITNPAVTNGPAARQSRHGMITICHPVWRLERGGLEQQLLAAVSRLPARDFRHVIVTCAHGGGPQPDDVAVPEHVRVVQLPAHHRGEHWAADLAEVLHRDRVDILHLRGLSMLLDGTFAAELAGRVRIAMSFHGFEKYPPNFNPIRRGLQRAAVRRCESRWAVSRAAAAAVCHELGIAPSEFSVVQNGVDASRFRPAAERQALRTQLRVPPGIPILLTVGNLKPIKRHADLIQAIEILAARGAPFLAVVVGQDHMNGRLHRLASEKNLTSHIIFTGDQPDPLPWYQMADIFVLPSRWEGMSNALLEAMSCGLPVVATSAGGNADVIQPGENGLLVPPASPESLADALSTLLKESSLRNRLGQAARRHIESHHTIEAAMACLSAQYRQIIEGPGRMS